MTRVIMIVGVLLMLAGATLAYCDEGSGGDVQPPPEEGQILLLKAILLQR